MLLHKLTTFALTASHCISAANHRGRSHRELARKQRSDSGLLSTLSDQDLCLGTSNNAMRNNQPVTLQYCDDKSTPKWRFEGSALKTDRNMCLDVPDGNDVNGQTLQIYQCFSGNTNQAWERVGPNTLRWLDHNKCVDVMDGCFGEESPIQLWECFSGNTNQVYDFSALEAPLPALPSTSMSATTSAFSSQAMATSAAVLPTLVASLSPSPTSAVSSDAGTFYGYDVISLSAFVARYPDCAQWQDALQAAGDSTGINPTFLGSIAMAESGCGPGLVGSDNAPYGPFQFMNDDAWNKYGGISQDRTNFWDAAYGAARYYEALIAENKGNLYQAMRAYNGPISQNGLPDYQNIVAGYMLGTG